jgi:aminoglycoside phosphotransferase (APT) family kinase protein
MSDAGAELADALGGEPEELAPLGGGAGRCEMWSATVGGRPVVYRRYPEGAARDVVRPREWEVLRLARDAGVPVAELLALTSAGIVVERVAGEARPRALLEDERWAGARAVLVARVAEAAARLHAIDPPPYLPLEPDMEGGATAPDLAGLPPAEAAVATLERHLDRLREPHPAIELGLRWLRLHTPPPAPRAIVHGDFRLSNLVVAEDGRPTLIDWELVHAGDGAEDLGWMCMRSWRFGSPLPALGCGTREELLAAYATAGGRTVSPEELRWWEVCANARWAVICMLQADRHLSGVDRSLERAMIGRRTCEAEWDLLALIAGDRPAPVATPTPQDRPDARELLEAVAEYLRGLRPRVSGEDAFKLAVAANACRVVARELPPGDPAVREPAAALAAALRSGAHDGALGALVDPLRARVRAKLEVANPRWLG